MAFAHRLRPLIQGALGYAAHHHAERVHGPPGQGAETRNGMFLPHALHFPRHAGEHQNALPGMPGRVLPVDARGRAHRIPQRFGPLGNEGLLEVGRGRHPLPGLVEGQHIGPALGILLQSDAEDLREELLGEIIKGGPQPASGEDELRARKRLAQQLRQILPVVAHGSLAVEAQPQLREALSDPHRVGVEAPRGEQFGSDGDAFDPHGFHRTTEPTERPSPATARGPSGPPTARSQCPPR